MKTWKEIEQALGRAVDHGIEPNVGRWLRFVGARDGDWQELQILGLRTSYGDRTRFAHVDSLDVAVKLLTDAERFNASGAYTIANAINDAVATRREPRQWHESAKGHSTSDKDIVARRVVFIDIDATRPSGTSASDEEVNATIPVAEAVYDRLIRRFGDARPIGVAHSGNGRQLYLALEETPDSDELTGIIRGTLTALGVLFGSEHAHIDASVSDAKRLVPAFGTLKRKGASGIVKRPHRRTAFVCDDDVRRISVAELSGLLDDLRGELTDAGRSDVDRAQRKPSATPKAGPTTAASIANGPFARANAVPVEEVANHLGLVRDGQLHCPGCGNADGVAFVNNGVKCHHNSCASKGAPGVPGFRTPVDLVTEVRQVDPREAVNLLAQQFGFDVTPSRPKPSPRASSKRAAVRAGSRPRILITTKERDVADDAIAALTCDPELYQRGGSLVKVIHDDEKPRILTLPPSLVRERLAHHVTWIELREKRDDLVEVEVHPPRWCVDAVHDRGEWEGIRPLQNVVEFPVMRPDGTVLMEPGYDAETQLLFLPNAEFLPVPDSATKDDAERARDVLLEVLHDFPFKAESNRSACLAALLTPFARHAFEGAVPSALVDGNTPGAGKGLVANVMGIIVTGRELDVRSECDNEDEFRKRIMSIARTGDPIVLIDNVTKPLGGGALDAALTARKSWSDRGMGTFDEIRTPMTAMWMFTGNNIEFKRRDTKRRCLHIRLEPDDANPENRQGFKHYPLLPYVHRKRPELVAAALTILRAYVVAGRPEAPLPLWGSFEEWSRLVRQAVVWVGLQDPYEARSGLDEGDTETAALAGLLEGWEELVNENGKRKGGCSASEALEILRQDDLARTTVELRNHAPTYPRLREALAELIPTAPGFLPNAQRLGNALRRFRGRVWDQKKLICACYGGTNVWRVVAVGGAEQGAAAPVHPDNVFAPLLNASDDAA